MEYNYKMKKISLLSFFLLVIFSDHAIAKDQFLWIGIEPIVFKSINQNKFGVFNYKEIKLTNDEIYFKIKNTELDKISHFIHHNFKRCGGFRVLKSTPNEERKKLQLKSFFADTFGYYDFQKNLIPDYSINQENEVNLWLPEISEEYMNSIITQLSSYKTRYYKSPEGILAMNWIGAEWTRLSKDRSDINVEYYKNQDYDQPTVILTIAGSDPELKNQNIILGGHGDSINTDNEGITSIAPGADDNAAGIAVLSEIIRVMIKENYQPKHTIKFIAYAAEEVGLRGSYELARVYREEKKQVLGVLQFDGVNYNNKKTFDMVIIDDNTNKDQNIFLAGLIDKYVHASWKWEQCGYACSDHAAWNYEGYRASFPAEAIDGEQNPYFHTANDTFDKSNYNTDHATIFTKLGIAYLIELDQ